MALQFCSDGVPCHKKEAGRSMWPLMSLDISLPPHRRSRVQNKLLHGIVEGPNDPPDFQGILHVLVDDALDWWSGFPVRDMTDPLLDDVFSHVRVMFVNIVADYPGLNKLCNRGSVSGASPCVCCKHKQYTTGRKFLHATPANQVGAAELLTDATIRREGARYEQFASASDRKVHYMEWGIKGVCAFARLPYFDLAQDATLDMMHIGSGNIGRHIFGSVLRQKEGPAKKPQDPRVAMKWGADLKGNPTKKMQAGSQEVRVRCLLLTNIYYGTFLHNNTYYVAFLHNNDYYVEKLHNNYYYVGKLHIIY